MKDYFSSCFRYFMLLMLPLTFHVSAETSAPSSVRLSGHVPSQAVEKAVFLDYLEAETHVPVTFTLPLRNQEVLEDLLRRLYDRADVEYYGKYLTSEAFVEQFAPTEEDYDQVIAYAKSLGLTVTGTHSNRTVLNAKGPVKDVETAFNLRLHQYQLPNGRNFFAASDNPEVPASIASIISGIIGLDNHAVWRSFHRRGPIADTDELPAFYGVSYTFPSGPGGGYSPNDLLKAYNLTGLPTNGAGQIIALFELGGYQTSDITQYTTYFGLPPAQLKNVLVDGGSSSGIDPEVTLDIELALALAPASQIYVYEGPNSNQGVLNTYNRIATDNLAKQVSTSWGLSENSSTTQQLQAENAIFQQMAAQGQTIYAAAGDSGAYDSSSGSLEVDDPAAQPFVVGVGGTSLRVNSTNGAYASEMVWNNGSGKGAGGGGVSTVWPIPLWQAHVSSAYSTTHRNVPDVALNADPNTGYAIYYNGQWQRFGGTSCAAPLWASFTALVNQERIANELPPLGFANPALYAIGVGASYAASFHDVLSGNNLYYSAGRGYDNATGWGSFNVANLFAQLTNSIPTSPVLNIAMSHTAPFTRGGIGTYQIGVSNHGTGATAGVVTVTIVLPKGLTYGSLSGSGWTFDANTLTCTQNSALQGGASYSPIILKVNVKHDAPNPVTPKVTVSGGGAAPSVATNPTTVVGR